MQPPVIGTACDSETDEVANAITPFHGELPSTTSGLSLTSQPRMLAWSVQSFRGSKKSQNVAGSTKSENAASVMACRMRRAVDNGQRHSRRYALWEDAFRRHLHTSRNREPLYW